MNNELSTTQLDNVLKDMRVSDLKEYFDENGDSLIPTYEDRPFTQYMSEMLKKKKLSRSEVFRKADIGEGYGSKILNMEKNTKQRDLILRICLVAEFDLNETNKALKLYGMAPLYSKARRDAVIIIALNSKMYAIEDVDALLATYNMEPLYEVRKPD